MKSQGQAAETETCKYKVESQNPLCIQLTTQTPAEFLCPSGLSYTLHVRWVHSHPREDAHQRERTPGL